MQRLLTCIFFVATGTLCKPQDLAPAWGGPVGGGGADSGTGVVLGQDGHVYLTGSFAGTADMDPGPGVYNLTAAGGNDIFVSKFDTNGTLLWAKAMGGAYSDGANSIAVDAAGNAYITGGFCGTADFDPGPGTFTLTAATTGQNDIFIAKLDASGDFVWAKGVVGGTWWDAGYGIALGPGGDVVVTGRFYYQGGPRDFDPGPGTFFLTAGHEDIFVLKLTADGDFVWAVNFGSAPDESRAYALAVDDAGNIITTGYFRGTVDFDPDPAATFNMTSVGTWNIFYHKMDADANLIWARSLPITTTTYHNEGAYGGKIAVDEVGNLYATGRFSGTIDFDPGAGTSALTATGNNDSYLLKFSPEGDLVWARSAGGTGHDEGFCITARNGGLFVAGSFEGTADLDPGAGVVQHTSAGNADIFLLELDTAGNLLRASSAGGSQYDRAYAVAPSPTGALYVTGWFAGTTDLDPGNGTLSAVSAGGNDAYLVKWVTADYTGIRDRDALPNPLLTVSPNPATDRALLTLPGLRGEEAVIELLDITGKRVYHGQVNALADPQPFTFPAELKEGLYLVMVRVEGRAPRSARVVLRR